MLFELCSKDRTLIEFQLPVYGNWLTAKKFFLFPLAAAADAATISAAGAAAGAIGAAVEGTETGADYSNLGDLRIQSRRKPGKLRRSKLTYHINNHAIP
jgi:hypothetical protein